MQKHFERAAVAACSLMLASAGIASAAVAPVHVRGTIATISSASLTVTTATGPVAIALSPKVAYVGALPATVDAIKTGTFIGSANVPGTGAARALEVVVFPAAMKGTGEGDYPWDLPSGGKPSAMTNGTVTAPHLSTMTNATVGHITTGTVRTLDVAYKGGTKKIAVGPNTPIVRLEPGTKALLAVGAHVFVVAIPKGDAKNAAFVIVGEHGTVPPM